MSEDPEDEIRVLLCHKANLKEEAVKGIIQRSEFKPKLAQHAQCVALICFKSQPVGLKSQFCGRNQKM